MFKSSAEDEKQEIGQKLQKEGQNLLTKVCIFKLAYCINRLIGQMEHMLNL